MPLLVWVSVPVTWWTVIYFESIADERGHFTARANVLHEAFLSALGPSCSTAHGRLVEGFLPGQRPLSLPTDEIVAIFNETGKIVFVSDPKHPFIAGDARERLAALTTSRVGGGESTLHARSGDLWWASYRTFETSVQPTCRFTTVVVTRETTRLTAVHGRAESGLTASVAWLVIGIAMGLFLHHRTERRLRAEREQELSEAVHQLHALHEFSERLVDGVPVGVVAVDQNMAITGLNRAQEALSHVPAVDAIGRPIAEVFPPPVTGPAADFYVGLARTLSNGQTIDKIYRHTMTPFSTDEKLRYRIRVAPLFDDDLESDATTGGSAESLDARRDSSQIAGAVILQEDQSNEARLEEIAFEAEKLSSVGVLAAGVAHEINNPLTSILGYSKLLLESKPSTDPDHRALTLVAEEATRVQEIVRNLLDFARPQRGDRLPTDVNSVADRSLGLVAPQLRRRKVNVVTSFSKALPYIQADGKALSQVMVNLFTNAARAMENGGTLTVTTDVTQGGGLQGPVILVVVEDTGTGISPADLPLIFDPFYTTHSRAGGTGLGLAISRGIVEEHRGKITVESEVGSGTRFRIYLPAAASDVAPSTNG